ncbi:MULTISPECIES: hypothetical protein [Bacillus]|uniref:hypothetical protein n=1 Tax=Bacillus TaxID=1386 RepID=UPI0003F8F2D0|nr:MULTISPECIES: hypothetical protein [Bacillus]QHZ47714.1 hypothetical protein M654_016130 [Bacillus sp. NSP9.1]WFA03769.1 hypothetical protein P3X63_13960 [Bacillus sp. HSf4]
MLDLLFDNPIIMAVIVGIISVIFNKIGKNDENEENNRKKAPEQRKTKAPKQQEKRHQTAEKPTAKPAAMKKSNDLVQELERIKADAERSMPAVERAVKKQSKRMLEPHAERLDINKKSVVQGIVLGEVFGPPRSRKPHYTMRRRP